MRETVVMGIEPDQAECGGRAGAPFLAADPAHPQPEFDVLARAEVREQRVRLEDHAQVAPARPQRRHVDSLDQDGTGIRGFESGQHPQRRRLATATRAEQRDELARVQREVEVGQRAVASEVLDDTLETHRGTCPGGGRRPAVGLGLVLAPSPGLGGELELVLDHD